MDFFNSAGGVDEVQIEFFSDFGVGGVDFLLERVWLGFESFDGFATIILASQASLVGKSKDEAVVGIKISFR